MKEGKTLHADKKTIASQLPPFSSDYDISVLEKNQKVQLLVELLLPYKSTFGTVASALEWACTTCSKPEIANIIIECYPDLVKAGNLVWGVPESNVKEEFSKCGYTTELIKITTIQISMYDLKPSPKPYNITVTCSSGAKGNSYDSWFCCEVELKVNNTSDLMFEREHLTNMSTRGYSYDMYDFGMFSRKD